MSLISLDFAENAVYASYTLLIDKTERKLDALQNDRRITVVPTFVKTELHGQIRNIEALAHHIKIITHRFREHLLEKYHDLKKLKKDLKSRLNDIEKQTKYLWNNISVKPYKGK